MKYPKLNEPMLEHIQMLLSYHKDICDDYGRAMFYRIRELEGQLARARKAVRLMVQATDEWAAEFTKKQRAMNWGVVNEAYCAADRVLKEEKNES